MGVLNKPQPLPKLLSYKITFVVSETALLNDERTSTVIVVAEVKVKVKVNFVLEQAVKALDVSKWSKPRLGRFTPGKETPVSILQEAGWAPGPFWTGAENLTPTEIRFPDRPARS